MNDPQAMKLYIAKYLLKQAVIISEPISERIALEAMRALQSCDEELRQHEKTSECLTIR